MDFSFLVTRDLGIDGNIILELILGNGLRICGQNSFDSG
jgi:hypothetical protein